MISVDCEVPCPKSTIKCDNWQSGEPSRKGWRQQILFSRHTILLFPTTTIRAALSRVKDGRSIKRACLGLSVVGGMWSRGRCHPINNFTRRLPLRQLLHKGTVSSEAYQDEVPESVLAITVRDCSITSHCFRVNPQSWHHSCHTLIDLVDYRLLSGGSQFN